MSDQVDAGSVDAGHIDVDDLADAAEGIATPEVAQRIETHLADCADCRAQYAAVQDVSRILAAAPVPAMPAEVVARLDDVIATEQDRRTVRGTPPWGGLGDHGTKVGLGSFDGAATDGKARWWRTALVAAAAAGAIGFGGYVLSASAGLNEPTAAAPVWVQSGELGSEAEALAKRSDLDAHAFSAAWRCANKVVKGRITGLVPALVDGQTSLLVYSRSGGRTTVTVVTGCPRPGPTAGPSAVLPN